ncbi:MAG: hypothetical protein K0S63_740, partial [Gammaproteobacteria bacterium]|nr:hypothetical protein [Gammaproteobacteria bacterium]
MKKMLGPKIILIFLFALAFSIAKADYFTITPILLPEQVVLGQESIALYTVKNTTNSVTYGGTPLQWIDPSNIAGIVQQDTSTGNCDTNFSQLKELHGSCTLRLKIKVIDPKFIDQFISAIPKICDAKFTRFCSIPSNREKLNAKIVAPTTMEVSPKSIIIVPGAPEAVDVRVRNT